MGKNTLSDIIIQYNGTSSSKKPLQVTFEEFIKLPDAQLTPREQELKKAMAKLYQLNDREPPLFLGFPDRGKDKPLTINACSLAEIQDDSDNSASAIYDKIDNLIRFEKNKTGNDLIGTLAHELKHAEFTSQEYLDLEKKLFQKDNLSCQQLAFLDEALAYLFERNVGKLITNPEAKFQEPTPQEICIASHVLIHTFPKYKEEYDAVIPVRKTDKGLSEIPDFFHIPPEHHAIILEELRTIPRGKDGPYKKYDEQGRLIEEGNLKNGLKNGEVREYRYGIDGEEPVLDIATYKDGQLDGPFKIYRKGRLTRDFSYKEGRIYGEDRTYKYDEDGKQILETLKIHTEEGFKEYDAQNRLVAECPYVNGREDGEWKEYSYDKNGKRYLREITTFQNGKFNGPCKEYDEKGRLISEHINKNYKIEGEWKDYSYDENGKQILREITTYQNGEMTGPCKKYDEQGRLISEYTRENYKIEGEAKHYSYDENGKQILRTIHTYQNGELNGPWKEYDEQGNLIHEWNYKDGKEVELETSISKEEKEVKEKEVKEKEVKEKEVKEKEVKEKEVKEKEVKGKEPSVSKTLSEAESKTDLVGTLSKMMVRLVGEKVGKLVNDRIINNQGK